MPRTDQLADRAISGPLRRTHDEASHLFSQRRERVPHYVAKAEKKGRTKAEVDEIVCWLTGHCQETLDD